MFCSLLSQGNEGKEILPTAGLYMETTQPFKESPEGSANLSITAPEDMKELRWDETPVQFTSRLSVQIKTAWAIDISLNTAWLK